MLASANHRKHLDASSANIINFSVLHVSNKAAATWSSHICRVTNRVASPSNQSRVRFT